MKGGRKPEGCALNEIFNRPKPVASGFLRELPKPNQGPGYYPPFLADPILPTSYQSYPLPAGSQFARGKTQMGIARVRPIWLTTTLVYNHARRLRLEKLLYLELSKSPNGF
jgi:hypothetical protein